jgi:tetratricopeptide (TPR) repeat protein
MEDGQVTESGEIWEGVVPGILRGLYVGRRTGTLTFQHQGEHRGVHLRRGSIVNADTDAREDRLGSVLSRSGRLSEADRRRAEGFALRDRKRLGSVLVEIGIMDRPALEEALALHVDAVLSKVFTWTEGRYEFREYAELPLADEMTLRVSTGDLILQAAHSVLDPDVVRYNLGDVDRALVASSDPLLRFQRIQLSPLDGYVMSRVDGVLTAREVVQLVPAPRTEAERSLFGLLSAGVIEYRGERRPAAGATPAPSALEPMADTVAPGPPAAPSTPESERGPGPERMPEGEREPPLGPERESGSDSLPGPEPTVILDTPSFVERASVDPTVILDRPRLEEAPVDPTIVLDPRQLPAPPARDEPPARDQTILLRDVPQLAPADLRRLEILDMHQGLRTRNHFDLLGVARDATEAQVREAYFRLAKRFHPDGQHEAQLGGTRDALEAIFRRLGEAYEVLRNPRIRVVYERNLTKAALAAPRDPSGPVTEVLEAPDAAVDHAAESLAAERYWEVIRILERAVPRADGALKQRGRVLLARAYARTPDWAKQAEELLLTVVQQDPSHVEAHFHLGVIYRNQGLRGRALKSFHRVLELAPGHVDARRSAAELQDAARLFDGGRLRS